MVAVTYGVVSAGDSESVARSVAESARKSKGLFTMLFEAIVASQMKRAEAEVARYRRLLVHDTNDELPFGGR